MTRHRKSKWKESYKKHVIENYSQIHQKIKKIKLKPEYCEICNENCEFLHLANTDHKYSENINDYIYLCVKCHWLYDNLKGLRKQ